MKERERVMKEEFYHMTYENEILSYENKKLSKELNPIKRLAFFPSTEKMNWFEANRVKLQRFSAFLRFFFTIYTVFSFVIKKVENW